MLQADATQQLSGVADEVRQLATQLRATADRASTNTATATSLTRRVTAHSNAVDTLRAEMAALAVSCEPGAPGLTLPSRPPRAPVPHTLCYPLHV